MIVTAGAGKELHRREMIKILLAAGYHNLRDRPDEYLTPPLQHLAPNRYQVVSDTEPGT